MAFIKSDVETCYGFHVPNAYLKVTRAEFSARKKPGTMPYASTRAKRQRLRAKSSAIIILEKSLCNWRRLARHPPA